MTTINKTVTSKSGKKVELTIKIENAKVSGIGKIDDGQELEITGYAIVQGRKCLMISGKVPYLEIDQQIYNEIDSAAKEQYRSSMTEQQILEGQMREAEGKYNRLFARGYDNVEIIQAREEWDRLSAEYHQKFG